jgi:4-alpha-glucanotransferase
MSLQETVELTAPAKPGGTRRAGVLLHITSLPGGGGCGDLGQDAYYFVNFLADCGMSLWQTLPLGPTLLEPSPYQTSSVHAGNPRLIALQPLLERGWILGLPDYSIDEPEAAKAQTLRHAFAGFRALAEDAQRKALDAFAAENAYWLDDYALFRALHEEQERPWWEWPTRLRDREPRAMKEAREQLAGELDYIRFEQHLFFDQWRRLRAYAASRGIALLGDMPIFVAHDSAEVWAHPQDFDLNADGSLRTVAGVPPDYFSATGQRWGNPLYNWRRMEQNGFRFWIERMRTQLRLYDLIRLDHFRGFESFLEIDAAE